MQRNILAVSAIVFVLSLFLFGCPGNQGPANATATQTSGGIAISWSPATGVAGYNIYRSTSQGTVGAKVNSALIVGQTSYTDTSVADGTTYYYTVKGVDAGGNEFAAAQQASATARTAPPRNLEIRINNGAKYAPDPAVTLSLSATGAKDCHFSNDGVTWSAWEAYATQKSWSLPAGDGTKTIYYQCKDEFENTGDAASSSIFLDTASPTLSMSSPVANGQYSGNFDLIFTATDGIEEQVSCSAKIDGSPAYSSVVDSGSEVRVTITAAPGQRTLVLKCSDSVRSVNKSATFNVVDKPSVSIHLGDGAGYTTGTVVTISVSAALANECRFSNDGSIWGDWQKYSSSVAWRLTGGEGKKTVYAQCKSNAGAVSETATDSIVLDDSPPPYVSVVINNENLWTNSRYVTLGLYAFAAEKCRYSNDQVTWTEWEAYKTRRDWTLSDVTGKKTVYYQCLDKAGKGYGTASATITYAKTEPHPPRNMRIVINDGSSYTSSETVNLRLYSDYAYVCHVRQDGRDWTDWSEYNSYGTYTLTGNDGPKTLTFECKNDYGSASTQSSIYLERDLPSPVSDLSARAGMTSVALSWSTPRPGGSIAYYEIFRSSSDAGIPAQIDTTKGTSYIDNSVQGGMSYSYTVRTRSLAGRESADSNPASATVPPGPKPDVPPSPISDLNAKAAIGVVSLTWSPPSYQGSGIAMYEIFRSNQAFGLMALIDSTTSTSYVDKNAAAGETYAYSVRSKDTKGRESDDSNIASVTAVGVAPEPPPSNAVLPN